MPTLRELRSLRKHLGPGPHPSGSPQAAHAGGRGVVDQSPTLTDLAEEYRQWVERRAQDQPGPFPFEDNPPFNIRDAMESDPEKVLFSAVAAWKGDPSSIASKFRSVLRGDSPALAKDMDWKKGVEPTISWYESRNQARMLLRAVAERSEPLPGGYFRGQRSLPRAGLGQFGYRESLKVGDTFEFTVVGTTPYLDIAEHFSTQTGFIFRFPIGLRGFDLQKVRSDHEREALVSGNFRVVKIEKGHKGSLMERVTFIDLEYA